MRPTARTMSISSRRCSAVWRRDSRPKRDLGRDAIGASGADPRSGRAVTRATTEATRTLAAQRGPQAALAIPRIIRW